MTNIHKHNQKKSAGLASTIRFSRRDFLRGGTTVMSGMLFSGLLKNVLPVRSKPGIYELIAQVSGKRIYIAPDDHTDYFWSAGETAYRDAFIRMIDYYLDLADATQNNPSEHQSRWNCDGSFWLWTYEKNKSKAEYDRLISRVKSGHISFPLNALVVCLGGTPAEAVIRGMYYAGKIERRENLRFRLAISMENQTLPLGLVSLWAGAGARFSWKGICGCDTQVSAAGDREHEIYWWTGLDGSKILMKWNSMLHGNQFQGGYAEARTPDSVIDFVDGDAAFQEKYPYPIIGCFGKGWDDIETLTDEFVNVARSKTDASRQVIVSNEEDFFDDFEAHHGSEIPSQMVTFGNEWDLYCAALAETSANVKRSLEKLRGAEAIATLVTLINPAFMDGRQEARSQAWMNFGLFWEHNFGMAGITGDLVNERVSWQKRLDEEISSYVNALDQESRSTLGKSITKVSSNPCFYVFNPLSWMRSEYADFPFDGVDPVHVMETTTGEEVPSQLVELNGKKFLRILASQIPSLGYKVFEIREGNGRRFADMVFADGNVVENQHYQVTVAENGAITSWKDKARNNREWVKQIDGMSVNDLGAGTGSIRVENEGAVSITIVAESTSPLNHTSRVTLFRDLARVEIQNEIRQNFDAEQTWSFGLNIENPNVWHEEVGAVINARLTADGGHYSPRDINSRYDWLTLNHFADMAAPNGGVTLSNADCYFMRLGNSTYTQLDTNTPRISVLAGGRVVGTGNGITDQGGAEYFLQRFALRSHDEYDAASAMKFALEHQNPLLTGEVVGTDGYPADQYSFLSVDTPNVLIWALKPAEDGVNAGIVVRVWNLSQSEQAFSLRSHTQIKQAFHLTHIETPLGNAKVQDGTLVDTLNAQQMKTYAIHLDGMDAPNITPGPPAATDTPGGIASATPAVATSTVSPATEGTTTPTPAPNGNGCLFGILDALLRTIR